MSLFQRFLAAHIARAEARARVFAAATVAAQLSGDRANVGRFHLQMCEAQARRDALRQLVQCCNHDCDEGHRCPART